MADIQASKKNEKFSKIVDIISVIFLIILLYIAPVWAVYEPHDPNGEASVFKKLILTSGIFSVFGAPWLLFRYIPSINQKYSFTKTVEFKLLIILPGMLLAIILMVLRG